MGTVTGPGGASSDPEPEWFWTNPAAELLRRLEATPAGLSGAEAALRLRRFGPNEAAARRRKPHWRRFLARFANPLILILLFASVLSAATGEFQSLAIIAVILGFSVILDFVQEVRAENAVEALRRSIALRATVLRDGAAQTLPAADLVPGDVVQLSAGDLVPADCRLLEARDLFVNQALLTGEAFPSAKEAIDLPRDAEPAEAINAVFMGTSVVSGTGLAVVCRTGKATALGGLTASLLAKPPPTAFEIETRRFGMMILRLTMMLVLFVLAVNLLFHRPWLESLMFALALAVGLTPELLPMIAAVTLARGAIRLAARKVIVKRLAAIHNLGAIDVLCTDKTGTLTEAKVRLVAHPDANGADSDAALKFAYLNSRFETGVKSPLDTAILEHAAINVSGWVKLDEVPFDFERRRVSVLAQKDGPPLLIVKGAPEDILRLSSHFLEGDGGREMTAETRSRLLAEFERFGESGLRALAIAIRREPPGTRTAAVSDECDLTFAGFAVFVDPPKASAAAAAKSLADSGVEVKILTGDNERVTVHLCAALGIPVRGLVTGEELSAMSEAALLGRIAETNLFCRVTPQQKQRVLLAIKRRGNTAGFLGDGINDASALHAADVGISVDEGADVAKEAADIVLLEHDLSVVKDGIVEGRRAVVNVTKYVMMGTSSNFGNMFSMAAASLFLPFLPMLPVQVLLNNLLYDGSEIALPFDTVDDETVARPVRWNLAFVRHFMVWVGPVSSIFDFLTFVVLLAVFGASEAAFHTGWFIESLATQILVVFVIRTRRHVLASRPHASLVVLGALFLGLGLALPYTPLGAWFGFVPPSPAFLAFLALMTAAYLACAEAAKRAVYRRYGGLLEAGKP
jgi:Mg2+-importing ATPase